MRRVLPVAIVSIAFVSLAWAQNWKADAQSSAAPTRVEADSHANAIRFFVNGKEQAVLDSDGLHINGSIDFTGTITDGNRYSQPPVKPQEAQ